MPFFLKYNSTLAVHKEKICNSSHVSLTFTKVLTFDEQTFTFRSNISTFSGASIDGGIEPTTNLIPCCSFVGTYHTC